MMRLLDHPADATVLAGWPTAASPTSAGGYESTSQFSREYRRQFGVPPGRDAERLRRPDQANNSPRALPVRLV